MLLFGPSGNPESYYARGLKSSEDSAVFTREMGLDLFEYSFGRGVNLSAEPAAAIGKAFAENGVALSVHAPDYSNFANPDPEMVQKSTGYILRCLERMKDLGIRRCVFHPAAQGKLERSAAAALMKDNVRRMLDAVEEAGFSDFILCPETMGKVGQMGTLPEVLSLCELDPRLIPCLDFGHINAREQGLLKDKAAFRELLDYLYDHLDRERADAMHVHFSKIEYGPKGELRHLTFADRKYGPDFEPLLDLLFERNSSARILSESAGTQAEDALAMKAYYQKLSAGPA